MPVYFDAEYAYVLMAADESENISFQPSTEIQVKLEDLTYIDGTINISAKMSLDSIDITTSFWFLNHTNLDLQFSDGGGSRCSLGPSPYIDGQNPRSSEPHIK